MLSGAQKTELRFYCGYSVLDEDSPVARAISALDSRPDSLPIILRELEVCKGIDGDLKKVPTLAMATQDGAIQLRAHYTLSVLQHQGRQAAGRLARFLGVPLGGDVFSASGDSFAGNDSGPGASGGCC